MPLSTLIALTLAAPITATVTRPAARVAADRIQLGFYRFRGNRVRVSFERRVIVDKVITAPPPGDRSGISDFVWVEIVGCGTLTVKTGQASVAQRLCPRDGVKSVRIDAGPPMTLTMLPTAQGND